MHKRGDEQRPPRNARVTSCTQMFASFAHPRHLLPRSPPLQNPTSITALLAGTTTVTRDILKQVLLLGRIVYKTASMASLLIAKGAVCSFSRSLKLPPLTCRPSGRRSTRLFATSSYTSSDHADYDGVEGEAAAERAKEKAGEASERAKVTARQGLGKAKEKATAAKDWTAEAAESAKEKTREGVFQAAEKSGQVKDRTAEKAGEVKDRTAETASSATEKSKEGVSKAAATTKEAVENLGEKAKQTVEGAWGAAKETTKKIKETVVGKDSSSELESEEEELEAARRRAAREGKANREID